MKYIFLLLMVFSFSCSRVEIVYDFAPKVMSDRLDDAFDFESDRYKGVRQQIKTNLTENKSNIIKSLTDFIDEVLLLTSAENLTPEAVRKVFQNAKAKEKSVVALFKPAFDKVILNLNEEEIREFQKYSLEKKIENERLLNSLPDFTQKRKENFRKTIGFFFDSIYRDQENLLEKFIAAHFEFYKLQAEARTNLVAQFTWPMTDKQKVSDYALKYYSLDPSVKTLLYNQNLAVFENSLIQFQVDLWSTLNSKQKAYFKNKLKTLKADLLKL